MSTQHKHALEEEKKLIETELSSIGIYDESTQSWIAKPEEESAPLSDENDMADRSELYEEDSAVMKTLNGRLADIKKSLEAIDNGTYGICTLCGSPIEEDRLNANPSAHTCKACMEKESY